MTTTPNARPHPSRLTNSGSPRKRSAHSYRSPNRPFYQWRAKHVGAAYRIGRHLRISQSDFVAWLSLHADPHNRPKTCSAINEQVPTAPRNMGSHPALTGPQQEAGVHGPDTGTSTGKREKSKPADHPPQPAREISKSNCKKADPRQRPRSAQNRARSRELWEVYLAELQR